MPPCHAMPDRASEVLWLSALCFCSFFFFEFETTSTFLSCPHQNANNWTWTWKTWEEKNIQDFKSSKLSNRLSILSTLWSSTLWVLTFCNLPCPWTARVCAKIRNVRQDLRHALGCDLSSSPPKVVPKVGHARIVAKKTIATNLFYCLWPFLAFCFSSCFSCFRRCFRRWDFERVPGFQNIHKLDLWCSWDSWASGLPQKQWVLSQF